VYTPHADSYAPVDEFETFEEETFAPVQAAAPPAPPPPAYPQMVPQAVPSPQPPPAPAPSEEFETFEEEGAIEESSEEQGAGRPLDAEKDIDAILAMALGKSAPPKGTKPTARPGVREELGSPMQSLMSKTKYRRP
jgi:hypothetical protein